MYKAAMQTNYKQLALVILFRKLSPNHGQFFL